MKQLKNGGIDSPNTLWLSAKERKEKPTPGNDMPHLLLLFWGIAKIHGPPYHFHVNPKTLLILWVHVNQKLPPMLPANAFSLSLSSSESTQTPTTFFVPTLISLSPLYICYLCQRSQRLAVIQPTSNIHMYIYVYFFVLFPSSYGTRASTNLSA